MKHAVYMHWQAEYVGGLTGVSSSKFVLYHQQNYVFDHRDDSVRRCLPHFTAHNELNFSSTYAIYNYINGERNFSLAHKICMHQFPMSDVIAICKQEVLHF